VYLWSHDVSLAAYLVLLVGFVFFLLPIANYQDSIDLVATVAAATILMSGSCAVLRPPWARNLVILIALAAIVIRCAETVAGSVTLTVLGASLSLLVITLLMGLFLIEVYRPGPITRFRVGGAVAAYLLLGLTWAYVYALVEFQAPGSLRFPDSAAPDQNLPRLRADVAYFSFTTLTTLGYGDILPVSPFARSMAVLEALVGQLFVATLIARLVSLRPPSPTREEDKKPSAK
jgi:voltage-gated potassium channel Kch